jgi:copper chaperone CopZ
MNCHPAAGNQSPGQPAVESPAVAQFKPDTAKVVFQVDGMSCSGCIATIKSSLAGYEGIRDVIVNISGGTAEVYKVSRCRRFSVSVTG